MDWLKWCQQLFPTKKNATINVTYRSGIQPPSDFVGAVYWCSSYDENGPHWCDWKDGYWKDSTLDWNTVPNELPKTLPYDMSWAKDCMSGYKPATNVCVWGNFLIEAFSCNTDPLSSALIVGSKGHLLEGF